MNASRERAGTNPSNLTVAPSEGYTKILWRSLNTMSDASWIARRTCVTPHLSSASVKSETFFSIVSKYSSSSLTSSSTSCASNFSTCFSRSPVLNRPSPSSSPACA